MAAMKRDALRPLLAVYCSRFFRFTAVRVRKTWHLLLVAGVVGLIAFAAIRTVVNSGPAAVAQMDGEERALLTKLETVRRGMSPAEVTAILGEPDDLGPLGLRPKWQVGGNPFNAIVVYFFSDGAHRILWLSVGRFSYERNL
jgi:hypothetical protein